MQNLKNPVIGHNQPIISHKPITNGYRTKPEVAGYPESKRQASRPKGKAEISKGSQVAKKIKNLKQKGVKK